MNFNPNCGCCGGKIVSRESEKEHDKQYFIKCACCYNEYQLKEQCAKSIYTLSTKSESLHTISVTSFQNLSIQHLCYGCKQIECFFCGKKHNSKYHLLIYN
jgi:hypothetical protein